MFDISSTPAMATLPAGAAAMAGPGAGATSSGGAGRGGVHEGGAGELSGDVAIRRLEDLAGVASALVVAVAGSARWSHAERAIALDLLDRTAGALARVRSHVVVAEQHGPGAVGPGDRDFVAALARRMRTGLGEARREVWRAEALTALPTVADAVSAGRVPLPHLEELARLTAGAGATATEALRRPGTQERLVQMAERQSVREFGDAAARLVASFEPGDLERSAEAQRRERFFVLSRRPEGTYLRGRLDHVSAEALRTAIASVGHAPDAERTKLQADADALVALAERAVSGMAGVRARRPSDAGGLLSDPEQDAADARVGGAANRPTVSVVVPAATFAELTREQWRVGGSGTAVEPAMLDGGALVALSQLAQLLCDSEIGRVVMGADGIPLDLGRTQRLYTGHQRRAVIVRDRQCAWNGCAVPAAFCEVHHIRWWDRDLGPTSVENGVLLCSHHHHVVHQLDLDVVRLGPSGDVPARGASALGEPVRYRFVRRDGPTVNDVPRGVCHQRSGP